MTLGLQALAERARGSLFLVPTVFVIAAVLAGELTLQLDESWSSRSQLPVVGEATVENIQLRCRAHNAYEAEQWFSVVREPMDVFGHMASGQLQPRRVAEDGIDSCPDVVRHP